jgi:hypothetical protein
MKIQDYRCKHAGETGVIVGNGESLSKIPLLFHTKYPTFTCNLIDRYVAIPLYYYTCIDGNLLTNYVSSIKRNIEKAKQSFISHHFQSFPKDKVIHLAGSGPWYFPGTPKNWGHTVTYVNLQLAYYMGFDTILLIGVDGGMDWKHFTSDYPTTSTGDARRARLQGMEKWYGTAREVYEADERSIYNLSPGTQVKAFERRNWREFTDESSN